MINMLVKLYIIFSSILTTSNIKTQKYKVVDLIEGNNFDMKSIFIWHHTKNTIFIMRQALVYDYYGVEILYYFFSILTFSNRKNSKLESCRSHRDLQFSYENYLHPVSYRRVMIFLKSSLVTLFPVTQQNKRFPRMKRHLTWQVLPCQHM